MSGGSTAPPVRIFDSDGNPLTSTAGSLNVSGAGGGGGGGNAAASTTSLPVPTSADYTGFNSGGNLVGVSAANPLPVAQQGSTAVTGTFFQSTQPVSLASVPLAPGASQDHTTAASPSSVRISTGAAFVDPTQIRALTSGDQVTIANTSVPVTGTFFQITQPVSGTVTANQGTANATPWNENVAQFGGAPVVTGAGAGGSGIPRVTVSNDSSLLGTKTNNNAAPGATNFGTLPVVANAAAPSWTEGNQVGLSSDLGGNTRVLAHPANALGYYAWNGSVAYTGLATLAPLFSMRWGDATRLAVILKVEIQVITTTTASAASVNERQLIIARSFTVADTGGTAVTLTGNNQKRRSSQGTSLVSDMRVGGPLTAGTRTLDAAPVSTVVGWSGALSTGTVIGASGSSPVGAARSTEGGGVMAKLLDATNGQDYPIVLAQNEGIIIRMGAAQPTGAANQTFFNIVWAEVNAY